MPRWPDTPEAPEHVALWLNATRESDALYDDPHEMAMCDALREPLPAVDPEPSDLRFEERDRMAADEQRAMERAWA